MRIPQPPERIKEVPALAVRAVFAGVGQVLLMTERVRRRTIGQVHTSPVSAGGANGPETARPKGGQASSVAAAPAQPQARAAQPQAAKAGTAEADAVKTSPRRTTRPSGTKPPAASKPLAPSKAPAASKPPVSEAAPSPAAGTGTAELPLPNYQELTFASIRARMRLLDADQVRGLLDYERTHAGRTNVIIMFERRIAKLEGTEDADSATP